MWRYASPGGLLASVLLAGSVAGGAGFYAAGSYHPVPSSPLPAAVQPVADPHQTELLTRILYQQAQINVTLQQTNEALHHVDAGLQQTNTVLQQIAALSNEAAEQRRRAQAADAAALRKFNGDAGSFVNSAKRVN
jgi:hypothetical protein